MIVAAGEPNEKKNSINTHGYGRIYPKYSGCTIIEVNKHIFKVVMVLI